VNYKYTLTHEQFIRDNSALCDRVLRAVFMEKFGWAPSFSAFRKKRQRMGLERDVPCGKQKGSTPPNSSASPTSEKTP
jgi:hypothetical protein